MKPGLLSPTSTPPPVKTASMAVTVTEPGFSTQPLLNCAVDEPQGTPTQANLLNMS